MDSAQLGRRVRRENFMSHRGSDEVGSKILIQEQMPDVVADTRWSGKSKPN